MRGLCLNPVSHNVPSWNFWTLSSAPTRSLSPTCCTVGGKEEEEVGEEGRGGGGGGGEEEGGRKGRRKEGKVASSGHRHLPAASLQSSEEQRPRNASRRQTHTRSVGDTVPANTPFLPFISPQDGLGCFLENYP